MQDWLGMNLSTYARLLVSWYGTSTHTFLFYMYSYYYLSNFQQCFNKDTYYQFKVQDWQTMCLNIE
jgi:hypothetical protein